MPGVGYGLLALGGVGVLGFVIWIVVTRSDPAANRFGPSPSAISDEVVA